MEELDISKRRDWICCKQIILDLKLCTTDIFPQL